MVSTDRCRFESDTESSIACWRETWQDHDRCVWHTEESGKPVSALIEARAAHGERLDSAVLRDVEFTNDISFEDCILDNADFRGSVLDKISFNNASLQGALFGGLDKPSPITQSPEHPRIGTVTSIDGKYTQIKEADFRDSNLDTADFSDVQFRRVSFKNASARDADFSRVTLIETRLPSDLEDATLQQIDFAGADLSGYNLDGANLRHANLSGAILPKKITGAVFEGSRMNGITTGLPEEQIGFETVFTDLNLDGVVMSGATLSKLIADSVSARALTARGAQFQSATFQHCDFEDAYLTGSNFRYTNFSAGNTLLILDLRNADLTRANLANQSLTNTNCTNITAPDADFSNSNISGSDFSGSMLQNTDFSGAIASQTDFDRTDLERARFTEAELFNSSFIHAKLYATTFAGIQLGDETKFGKKVPYDPSFGSESSFFKRWVNNIIGRSYNSSSKTPTTNNETKREDSAKTNRETRTPPLRKAITTYHSLEQICRSHGLPELEAHYFVRRQEMQRLQHRAKGRTIRKYRALLSRNILLYGESPERLILTATGIVSTAAFVYPLGGWLMNNGEPLRYPSNSVTTASTDLATYLSVYIESLYFSTVTFLTLGANNIQPIGFGRWLAVTETALGALLLALLVYVYGRRASR